MTAPLTLKTVDWLLHNLPILETSLNTLEPRVGGSLAIATGRTTGNFSSEVESLAIRRATLSLVLDTVNGALKLLHPDERKVFRMKYQNHMKRAQMAKSTYSSEATISRRITRIRETVYHHLMVLPGDVMGTFWRQMDGM